MSHIIQSLTTVLPIIFVLFLGYFANEKKAFGDKGDAVPIVNKLVLSFALPASLFVGTMEVSKKALESEVTLFLALFLCLLVAYGLGFFVAKRFFKRNMIESSIAGLAVSFSAGPFYGPALLGGLYGSKSDVPISLITLILNVIIVPLATILIKICINQGNRQEEDSVFKMIGQSLYHVLFKTPFVWAPLLALILVLCNVHMPTIVADALQLIGKAAAGTAIFVAGMTIAEHKFNLTKEVATFVILKNIIVPILFVGVALLCQMHLGTDVFNQGLLLCALPSGPMIVLLATEYKQYRQEASSILGLSTVSMIVTVTLLIIFLNI